MSFTSEELDAMRALIRARTGLPEPPRRAKPAPWAEPPPFERASPSPSDVSSVEAPAILPGAEAEETPEAPGPVSTQPEPELEPEPEVEVIHGWRPDADIHRLVELLMRMRALSAGDPLGRSAGVTHPSEARAA